MKSQSLEKIRLYPRVVMNGLIDDLTESELNGLKRIFPNTRLIPDEKITSVILLCERTIEKRK